MAPITKGQAKAILAYILTDIFEDDEETRGDDVDNNPGPIRLALQKAKVKGILDLNSMSASVLESLAYYDTDTKVNVPLEKGEIGLLKTFRAYIYYRDSNNEPLDSNEAWLNLKLEDFQRFRVSKEWFTISENPGKGLAPASSGGNNNPRERDAVADFKRGIKRDIGLFPTLKQDKQWDVWQRATTAQARAQDLSEVLTSSYVPLNPNDQALFQEKQKYMYAVFERTLLSDKGKALVREHTDDFNAQHVYTELCAYALKSTKATIDSSNILTYITSSRLGDGTWKSDTHSYLLHWRDQVRKYEDLIPKSDHFSDGQKRTMLENAVHNISDLRQVQIQASHDKVRTGTAITYDQYVSLLLSGAMIYDAQLGDSKPARSRAQRQIYAHDIDTETPNRQLRAYAHDIDTHLGYDHGYDHAPVSYDEWEVYNASYDNGPRLSKDQWTRLPQEARTKWDELSPESKHIILEAKTRPQHRPPRKANLHELTRSDIDAAAAYDFIQTHLHELQINDNHEMPSYDSASGVSFSDDAQPSNPPNHDSESKTLLAHLTKRTGLPPGDLQRVLSSSINKTQSTITTASGDITINGKTYREVNMARTIYVASDHRTVRRGALVDRGANGGIAGDDVRIINESGRQVDVQGIDNHQIVDIPIVTAGAVVNTQRGDVIIIMHQYAWTKKGKSIHSSGQMEWYKQDVDDKSRLVGGKQRIKTLDGYFIPINIQSGLPYVGMRPYTDAEWDSLPHVILTSDDEWHPSVLDNNLEDDDEWFDAISNLPDDPVNQLFDQFGDYRHRTIVNKHHINDPLLENHVLPSRDLLYQVHERDVQPAAVDFGRLRPYFAWLPAEIIKKTLEHTTQHASLPMSTYMKRHYKSPFPAFNVHRRDEAVATDTVYSDTPAIACGHTSAQFYCGMESLVCDVYGMKTDKQFVNTLEDNIRRRGAPNRLLSDRAQVEISNRVQDILRAYCIGDWQSEPYHQNQNPAERRYQDVKRMSNVIMDRTGSPPYLWLLALTYICFILNFTSSASLDYSTPMTRLTGSTSDSSILQRFSWYEPVYFNADETAFPSESREILGHFVGFSETVGHGMTFQILSADTLKIFHRSEVRSALNPDAPNLRADLCDGEVDTPLIIKSIKDVSSDTIPQTQLEIIDPSDLIGRTFLTEPQEDGQRFRARIVRAIAKNEQELEDNPERVKFVCSMNNDAFEDIVAYSDIIQHLARDEDDAHIWKFRRITAHEGPLASSHPNWKGSSFNVMVEWEDGSITAEPLGIIAADDPVTCAIYARDNDLLLNPGWKRFKTIAKKQKKMFRMANQAKLRSFRTAPKYQYGFEIPRNYAHCIELDAKNGNLKWTISTVLEFEQLAEYDTFTDLGIDGKPPADFKKIRVHLIYAVKHDGRHKARCVADGHLTDIPLDSVYSGVVSLRGIRILIFLAELNKLNTWATDIGNAYLEALTSEKLFIVAGAEFGPLQGHILIIYKALYGLRTSGLRWHDRFADVLRSLGFNPCVAEPDIWIRRDGNIYEYVAVYVDNLAFAMREPQVFVDVLREKYKFKLKGTGDIAFHLGCDFYREDDGTLCMAPRKYIEKMLSNYERMFGEKPRLNVYSPLEKGDHPELDDTELLDENGTQQYQSLIGSLQWSISLGRLDICTAVMTMSSFRAVPKRGHLDRAKRICCYLARMKHAAIRFCTEEPDYSDLPTQEYDWERSVYGNVTEDIPADAPEPLGGFVTLTHYVDANLYHCMLTGRSVTGVLHLLNQCPIDWYSKKQATVETATYGSEFVAARTCVEQVMDLRSTLRYLGVPIRNKSIMFGDNKSVVDSSVKIHSKLHKRHTALSFHRVREAVAAKIIGFFHLDGKRNPADVLSKHWGYAAVWPFLQPLLFWKGDTANIGKTNVSE